MPTLRETPPKFLEYIEGYFGWRPTLDAAASESNAKAPLFFTEADNGLLLEWFGHVWLNPPFGRAISDWLHKCALEITNPNVDSIMVLIPARTDTKWFHELVVPYAHRIYLIKGRFNFSINGITPQAGNAAFPNMLVVYDSGHFGATIETLEVPREARGWGA